MLSIEPALASFSYASNEKEALARYEKTRFSDPFPTADRALLNREDIARYVAETGMIYPFDWKKLKPASYEAQLGSEVLFWDSDGKKKHLLELSPRQSVTFRHNSITYVGLNVRFQLPVYMAVRFNLTITHVHRGLLLGTGPLVDPGYQGNLMIPIHNLTPNDYVVRPGDDLVAIEFTKISTNPRWTGDGVTQDILSSKALLRNVKEPGKTFDTFLRNALPGDIDSVRSSLDTAIKDAEKATKTAEYWTKRITVGVILAIAVAVIAMVNLIDQVHKYVTETKRDTQTEIRRLEGLINSRRQPNAVESDGRSGSVPTTQRVDPLPKKAMPESELITPTMGSSVTTKQPPKPSDSKAKDKDKDGNGTGKAP